MTNQEVGRKKKKKASSGRPGKLWGLRRQKGWKKGDTEPGVVSKKSQRTWVWWAPQTTGSRGGKWFRRKFFPPAEKKNEAPEALGAKGKIYEDLLGKDLGREQQGLKFWQLGRRKTGKGITFKKPSKAVKIVSGRAYQ